MKKPIVRVLCVVVVFTLVIGRLLLPYIVRRKINQTLSNLPDYTGHVERVHLALWRGAVVLKDLTIKHRERDFSLSIKRSSLRMSWTNLLRRLIVLKVKVESPRIRMLVERPSQAVAETKEKGKEVNRTVQAKTGQSLPDLLAQLIPFRVNSFILTDGSIRVRDKSLNIDEEAAKDEAKKKEAPEGQEKEPGAEARITNIEIVVKNLTNTRKDTDTLMATGEVSARVMNDATVLLHLRINPVANVPTFYMGLEVRQLDLTSLNPIFRWQWGIDAKRGTFELFSEAAAADGRFKGYLKPLIRDLKMVDLSKEKNPAKIIKEAVVGAVATIFKNAKKDQVATKIPFEGQFENPQAGIWEAIVQVLRNAFIEALKPSLDRSIKLKDV